MVDTWANERSVVDGVGCQLVEVEISKKHRGAHAELVATAWLLSRGFDVFRNVSSHGLADLVAVNFDSGERMLVDVKSSSYVVSNGSDGSRVGSEFAYGQVTEAQKRHGVLRLTVMRDGNCVLARDTGLKYCRKEVVECATRERRPAGVHISVHRMPDGSVARDVAHGNGIGSVRFHERVRDGWSVARAATEPLGKPGGIIRRFMDDGRVGMAVAELNGIKRQVFYKRLAHGWSVERAATEPVRRRRG